MSFQYILNQLPMQVANPSSNQDFSFNDQVTIWQHV